MLVIRGLSLSSSRLMTAQLTAHDPTTLALLKASCLLYIVELSFTCDEFYNTALLKKMSQHHFLVASLLTEGWKIALAPVPPLLPKHLQWNPPPSIPLLTPDQPPPRSPACALTAPPTSLARYVYILLFTHSCIIHKNIPILLEALSVPRDTSHSLLTALSVHTVRSSDSIIRTRRLLERNPSTFARPALYRPHPFAPSHDPP